MDVWLVRVWRDCGIVFTIFVCFIVLLYLVNDSPILYSGENSLDGCMNINSILDNISFVGEPGRYTEKCGFSVYCYTDCFNSSLEGVCVNGSQHCWSLNGGGSIETMDSCLKKHDIYYCACKIRNNCITGSLDYDKNVEII